MANIILAYIIGVLCGVGYMYLKYSKRLRQHMVELDEIARNNAWLNGRLDALYAMAGLDLNGEKENDQQI